MEIDAWTNPIIQNIMSVSFKCAIFHYANVNYICPLLTSNMMYQAWEKHYTHLNAFSDI